MAPKCWPVEPSWPRDRIKSMFFFDWRNTIHHEPLYVANLKTKTIGLLVVIKILSSPKTVSKAVQRFPHTTPDHLIGLARFEACDRIFFS